MRGAAGVIDDAFACEWVAAAQRRWTARCARGCCRGGWPSRGRAATRAAADARRGRGAPRCSRAARTRPRWPTRRRSSRPPPAAEELPAYAKGESFADARVPAARAPPSCSARRSASRWARRRAEPGRNTVQLQVHTDWRARVLQEQSFDPRSPVKSLCSSPTRQSQKRMVKDAWGSRNALAKGAALGATPTRYDRRASNSSPGRRASQSPGFRVVG